MAYTPYQQALPDTTLYQRLTDTSYVPQGMQQNPYNPSMLSQEAQDYYADPFGFVNKRFKTPTTSLDELLKPQTSAAKMFNNLGASPEGEGNNGVGDPDPGAFGIGMDIGGVDAGLGGPGGGVGMSPNNGGMLGAIAALALGLPPTVGFNLGKSLATTPPTTNTPPSVIAAMEAQQAQNTIDANIAAIATAYGDAIAAGASPGVAAAGAAAAATAGGVDEGTGSSAPGGAAPI